MGVFRSSFLLAFTVTTTLLAAGSVRANSGNHSINNFDQFIAFREDSRTKEFGYKLKVNPRSELRLVVPNKCKTQGEAELRLLASTEVIEESYVYIPSICLWIEVGHDEARTSVVSDLKFINRLLESFDQIVIYHIHVGDPSDIAGYFPAYRDLVSIILVNAKFFRKPKIQVSHRVVTNIGVIDYQFLISQNTNRLIDKLIHTGLNNFIAQNLAYFYTQQKFEKRYYAKIHECGHLIDGDSERLSDCFPIKVGNFTLEYRILREPNSAAFYK